MGSATIDVIEGGKKKSWQELKNYIIEFKDCGGFTNKDNKPQTQIGNIWGAPPKFSYKFPSYL